MHVSDLWPKTALTLKSVSEGLFYDILVSFEKFLYRNSFACMGQSSEITSHLISNGSKFTLLFRNGVDLSRFKNLNFKTNRNLPLKIVYAGLLGVARGILDLCKNVNFSEIN